MRNYLMLRNDMIISRYPLHECVFSTADKTVLKSWHSSSMKSAPTIEGSLTKEFTSEFGLQGFHFILPAPY